MGVFHSILSLSFCLLLVFHTCIDGTQHIGQIYPGFQGSQMDWMNYDGLFLLSNSSIFAFGFFAIVDAGFFVLVVIHQHSSRLVWTANRGLPVKNSDKFVFDKSGNVYLENAESKAWSTDTAGATSMELLDSGNLVLLNNSGKILWQSFSYPTDTLLPGQQFVEGMQLKSFPKGDNLFHYLNMNSGDMILSVGYQTRQIYWSMSNETRKITKKESGRVFSSSLENNSWNFYDRNLTLIWQFVFWENSDVNATWAAFLGHDGSISFINLPKTIFVIKIPQNSCGIPDYCEPYFVCSFENRCQCPTALRSHFNCKPQISACNTSNGSVELLHVGDKLNYFALGFVLPFSKSDLDGCKEACRSNCSCRVLFFDNSSGSCYLFDQIGTLQRSDRGSASFISYVKVSSSLSPPRVNKNSGKHTLLVVIIVGVTILIISGLIYLGWCYYQKKKKMLESYDDTLEEDEFFGNISGRPIRYSFNDLLSATKNFSMKLGQGGFGSVYHGFLPVGTQVAVKKLESIGQGKKEFRAEVSIIGNVHHVHLVKLKGFCAEGPHRLLVYEYMGKGSLDKWIFKKNIDGFVLDWETRYNIALGMAKGLAYLHEECDVKIVHCDIKPENVLLDDNYLAKVSDFGLAKLMNREQSKVFTTLRGTRGYLAPEWITNHAISEKSDVYSFGMVLLEIIGGRKNYEPGESSEKSYFPSYTFKMMEEGKHEEILDSKLNIDEDDVRAVTAIKVALCCIQGDMQFRPPMTKVVQMLEGLCAVPQLPNYSEKVFNLWSSFFQSSSSDGTNHSSGALPSNVQLGD